MADEECCQSLRAEGPNRIQETIGLGQRQAGSRFIEDEELRGIRKRFGDLNKLPGGHTVAANQIARINVHCKPAHCIFRVCL